MKASSISKVTLRQEKLKSGKLSLYLDFYPPIWNPNIKKMSRREFLGLYLIAEPQDKFGIRISKKCRAVNSSVCISLPNRRINSRWTTTKPS